MLRTAGRTSSRRRSSRSVPSGTSSDHRIPHILRTCCPTPPYKDELGLGLFGSLPIVRVDAPLRPAVQALLDAAAAGEFADPQEGLAETVDVQVGTTHLSVGAVVQDATATRPVFVGIEEDLP